MIVDKEIEVRLMSQSIIYYENLGYKIPRYYDKKHHCYSVKQTEKLLVKIEDIPKYSHQKITVKCDNPECKKGEYLLPYSEYNISISGNKHYCHFCAIHIKCSGDNSVYRRYPEKLARGDKNGSRTHPECLKRGDENPSRLHPERLPRGENHYNWKTDRNNLKAPLQKLIRQSLQNKSWILDCFTRDNFTCQKCKKIGGILRCHHIFSLSDLINIIDTTKENYLNSEISQHLFNVENGITFCESCHKKFHKKYKYSNNPQQLQEFLTNSINAEAT